jgi:EmrB/QacA subfamily drug resistance transporter
MLRARSVGGSGGRRWWILGAMCLATAVTEFDETVMAVALPSIDASFRASLTAVQWSVTAYVLAFAALLVPAGRLADTAGPRRVFLAGGALFAAGSAACALAPGIGWLIAARVVQGAGAAAVGPASFAIVVQAFPREERARALGLWTAAVAVGAAVGPLGGGVLIELFGWRAIFVMGLPIALVAMALVVAAVPGGRPTGEAAPPALDVLLLAGGLTLLLLGLGQGDAQRFADRGFALLAAGVVLLGVLAFRDARRRRPLLELRLLRMRSYLGVNVVLLVAAAAWLAMLLLQGVYLQSVLRLTPLEAGLALMPITGAAVVSAPVAGHLVGRVGVRALVVTGLGLLAFSLALLALVDAHTDVWPQLVAAYTLNGIGWGLLQTPLETDAVRAAGEPRAGLVAGFLGMTYQVGAAVGIAAATISVQTAGAARVETELARQGVTATALQQEGLTRAQIEGKLGTRDVARELPGVRAAQAAGIAGALRDGFVHALTTTMAIGAAVVAAGGVLALALLGRPSARAPGPEVLTDA